MTMIDPRKEVCRAGDSNHGPPLLKSCTQWSTEVPGALIYYPAYNV